jgi:hypothetical protein
MTSNFLGIDLGKKSHGLIFDEISKIAAYFTYGPSDHEEQETMVFKLLNKLSQKVDSP